MLSSRVRLGKERPAANGEPLWSRCLCWAPEGLWEPDKDCVIILRLPIRTERADGTN